MHSLVSKCQDILQSCLPFNFPVRKNCINVLFIVCFLDYGPIFARLLAAPQRANAHLLTATFDVSMEGLEIMKKSMAFLAFALVVAVPLSASAAFIQFTEGQEGSGAVVQVVHDSFDWSTDPADFIVSATAEEAHVDAFNIFRFPGQGSDSGQQVMALLEGGIVSDVLVATWQSTGVNFYNVHWDFFSDPASFASIDLSNALRQEEITNNVFGLDTFSLAQGVDSGVGVPEPGTLALTGLGVVGLVRCRTRKHG